MIGKLVETPVVRRARYLFVGVLYVVLMLVVYGAAALQGWLDHTTPSAEPHSVENYRTIFSIWATIVLVTPALCFHVFSRSDAANTYWRAFWTFAYLSFLVNV